MQKSINILFLASEADPFIKIGGLADVAGSLPLALRALPNEATRGVKMDVRLVLPFHRACRTDPSKMHLVTEFEIHRSGDSIKAKVYETTLKGMPVYFIEGDPLTLSPRVYSMDLGSDRDKYSFFSLAAVEMLDHLDWQVDILHSNDWHTALALYALRWRKSEAGLSHVRTVLTLHNLPYMGGEAADTLEAYGLAPVQDDSLPPWARSQLLPLGLWAADMIIPVSPTYAREILTPEFGCGLESFLCSRGNSIAGILNGLDTTSIDPKRDKSLAKRFSIDSLERRSANKTALQKLMDLPREANVPILGMVGRIDQQKGIDLAFEAMRLMTDQRWQFVLLGSGDPDLEAQAVRLQTDHSDRVRVALRYDAPLGRQIYGGADMFLMPSRYEPCGLAQMYAMRYGCVPIVHATGGLKDTVKERRTGFLCQETKTDNLAETIRRALRGYADPMKWQRFQRNGMNADFSWSKSAHQYAKIYHALVS